MARRPEVQGVGEAGLRSGVVHRLDVDTSGVLLFATEEAVWQDLRTAFSEHRVEKTYRAIVVGRLEGDGAIELGERAIELVTMEVGGRQHEERTLMGRIGLDGTLRGSQGATQQIGAVGLAVVMLG